MHLTDELGIAWEYLRAILKYWWLIIVGPFLTLLDFVERAFSTWYQVRIYISR